MFSLDLERAAFRSSNGEFGWTREQVPLVIEILRSRQLGILGGELWWIPVQPRLGFGRVNCTLIRHSGDERSYRLLTTVTIPAFIGRDTESAAGHR
jgi:hypothetical protein